MQRPRGKNEFGQEHRVKLERRQGPGPIVFAPQHAEFYYLRFPFGGTEAIEAWFLGPVRKCENQDSLVVSTSKFSKSENLPLKSPHGGLPLVSSSPSSRLQVSPPRLPPTTS